MSNNTYPRKKRMPNFSPEGDLKIDYTNLGLLRTYITETGRIVPSRITSTPTSFQREIAKAIKYARYLALLPFCDSHK